MGKSLRVQIQLAVTPGPSHSNYVTYEPRPRPPSHRGIIDCAVWGNISSYYGYSDRNAQHIYQIARKLSTKKTKEQKENRKYFRANQSEDVSSPAPSNPTTSCGKTYTPTFFIVSGSFRCFCSLLFTYGSPLMTTLVTINVHIYVSWKITFKSELAFSGSYFNR